jgi:imidazolonepropionase-like amidohydrolase
MTTGGLGLAQDAGRPPKATIIKAGRLIDVRAGRMLIDRAIRVEGERIKAVGAPDEILKAAPRGAAVIDLSKATVLPGLIDAHTHVLLQGDITQADYDEQLLKESIPYRTIRATVAARTALMNGFTTIRDLETEAMYADVDVKRAIQKGIIPGPRMFVSTRAFSATGMYPLLGYSWELKVPEGVQVVDGPDEIRKAVREQVKFGADWIKFYCDRKYYLEGGKLRSKVNFTEEEMGAIVGEAHRLDRRVATHAIGKDGIMAALKAGVDTIEHGDALDEESIDLMVARGRVLVPDDLRGRGPGRRRESDLEGHGGSGTQGVRPGGEEGSQDRLRDGRRRVLVDREPGQGVLVHGPLWEDADAGDPLGHVGRRRAARCRE